MEQLGVNPFADDSTCLMPLSVQSNLMRQDVG